MTGPEGTKVVTIDITEATGRQGKNGHYYQPNFLSGIYISWSGEAVVDLGCARGKYLSLNSDRYALQH